MQQYGLIGYPLSHSFSRRFFTEYFSIHAIEAEYLNFEISEIALLPDVLEQHPNLAGFNVTIPYKEAVLPFLDSCDPDAAAIRAVNTVKADRSGGSVKLRGYNTDLIGFHDSIAPLLKPGHRKALILGSGGASKAVKAVFARLSIPTLQVSRETRGKDSVRYQELTKEIMDDYTVIVNTTPLGTYPNTDGCPDLPWQLIGEEHLLFDLVYNPPVTTFLQRGADQGAAIKNGYEMLEQQALAAWEIWNR